MTENFELIQRAIRGRLLLVVSYDLSERIIEPHLAGYNQRGKLTLSAWQRSGGSGVGWRDFIIPKIASIYLPGESFDRARPGYNPNDRTMSQILARLSEPSLAR
jgi:hypothetical protein